jgi:hypothetical protein
VLSKASVRIPTEEVRRYAVIFPIKINSEAIAITLCVLNLK